MLVILNFDRFGSNTKLLLQQARKMLKALLIEATILERLFFQFSKCNCAVLVKIWVSVDERLHNSRSVLPSFHLSTGISMHFDNRHITFTKSLHFPW